MVPTSSCSVQTAHLTQLSSQPVKWRRQGDVSLGNRAWEHPTAGPLLCIIALPSLFSFHYKKCPAVLKYNWYIEVFLFIKKLKKKRNKNGDVVYKIQDTSAT